MFGQDRDSLRRAYAEAWQRHRDGLPLDMQQQRIADVLALHPERVKNLVAMVTPVDFRTPENLLSKWAQDMDVDAVVDSGGNVSGEMLNVAYVSLMPFRLMQQKYVGMTDILDNPAELENFLRMEKWIFDSPDQAGEAFRQFIKDFYQGNKLIRGGLDALGHGEYGADGLVLLRPHHRRVLPRHLAGPAGADQAADPRPGDEDRAVPRFFARCPVPDRRRDDPVARRFGPPRCCRLGLCPRGRQPRGRHHPAMRSDRICP